MKQIIIGGITCLLLAAAFAADPTPEIRLDQAGYLPAKPKLAMVVAKVPATDFSVRKASDGSLVFKGKLAAAIDDADTGDRVQAADFTRLARHGKYYVEVPGVGRSRDISVAPDVYSRVCYLAMRSSASIADRRRSSREPPRGIRVCVGL
jgi:endoglucanase